MYKQKPLVRTLHMRSDMERGVAELRSHVVNTQKTQTHAHIRSPTRDRLVHRTYKTIHTIALPGALTPIKQAKSACLESVIYATLQRKDNPDILMCTLSIYVVTCCMCCWLFKYDNNPFKY